MPQTDPSNGRRESHTNEEPKQQDHIFDVCRTSYVGNNDNRWALIVPALCGIGMEIYIVTQGITFDESGWNYSQVNMSSLRSAIACQGSSLSLR